MKKMLIPMMLCSALPLLTACEDAEVTQVKKQALPYCESFTVGEVMDSLMQEAYWGMDSDVSGKTTVVVEGMVVDENRLVPAEFKFSHAAGEHVELLTFALNQRAQPTLLAHKFFARVCSDDYLTHFESGVKSAVGVAKAVAEGVKDTYNENEKEISEFSDKVINVSGKLLNKALDKANELVDDYQKSKEDSTNAATK